MERQLLFNELKKGVYETELQAEHNCEAQLISTQFGIIAIHVFDTLLVQAPNFKINKLLNNK